MKSAICLKISKIFLIKLLRLNLGPAPSYPINKVQHSIQSKTPLSTLAMFTSHADEQLLRIFEWLSPLAGNFERKQLEMLNIANRQDLMGSRTIKAPIFQKWMQDDGQMVLCTGMRTFNFFTCILYVSAPCFKNFLPKIAIRSRVEGQVRYILRLIVYYGGRRCWKNRICVRYELCFQYSDN